MFRKAFSVGQRRCSASLGFLTAIALAAVVGATSQSTFINWAAAR